MARAQGPVLFPFLLDDGELVTQHVQNLRPPLRHHEVSLLHVLRHNPHRLQLHIVLHVFVDGPALLDRVPNLRDRPANQVLHHVHLRVFQIRPLVGQRRLVPVNPRDAPRFGRPKLFGPLQYGHQPVVELHEIPEVRVDPLLLECGRRLLQAGQDFILRAFHVVDGTGEGLKSESIHGVGEFYYVILAMSPYPFRLYSKYVRISQAKIIPRFSSSPDAWHPSSLSPALGASA